MNFKFCFNKIVSLLAICIVLLLVSNLVGCKKAVQIDPPITNPTASTVYNTNSMAIAVLSGIYERMIEFNGELSSGSNSIGLLTGLSSDELQNFAPFGTWPKYYGNALSAESMTDFWNESYQYIYTANAAIEGLSNSAGVTKTVKDQLIGEAKFTRAFFHFYLVNLFGDVPLVLSTDYRTNSTIARTPKAKVYEQIVKDLQDAKALLSTNFLNADLVTVSTERIRPTKWAASALLARTYLYLGDWADAENEATTVISNNSLFSLVSLSNVFLKNSNEAIWQLSPVLPGNNTFDAFAYVLSSVPGSSEQPASISPQLLNAFENGDARLTTWIGSYSDGSQTYYYPYKYTVMPGMPGTPVTEYTMVLRLAELYLIRAESRAHLNMLPESIADLDIIRQRAGLPLIETTDPGISQAALLDKIIHERQVELFTEWGHRWFDLKRTNMIDPVMSKVTPSKGGTWSTYKQLFPIPLIEIQRDNNLTQNTGY